MPESILMFSHLNKLFATKFKCNFNYLFCINVFFLIFINNKTNIKLTFE